MKFLRQYGGTRPVAGICPIIVAAGIVQDSKEFYHIGAGTAALRQQ
jgi:hypothetical protein